jgi:UDP-glucose 4-epimerase
VSRVLVTGGARAVGAAIVRRLLADPDYEVRVADRQAAPDWMREGCEVRTGDLRDGEAAREATRGCPLVVHVATGGAREVISTAAAVVEAAVAARVERLCLVSSAAVYERAERFPTSEEDAGEAPVPVGARAFAELAAERLCRAAREEDGLPTCVCRPSDPYGPDDEPGASVLTDLLRAALAGAAPARAASGATRTPTFARDVADGVVAALSAPAAVGEEINLAATEELTLAELERRCREAAGQPGDPQPPVPRSTRRHPSAEKAARLLGWRAGTSVRRGIELTAARLREQKGVIA